MIRRRYDHTIRLTQAELHPGMFPLPVGTQVLVTNCAGEVRQSFGAAIVEVWADPDDDEAELHWSVCIGVVALGEWARRCAWEQLDECCTECWGLGIRGPCRRHRVPREK